MKPEYVINLKTRDDLMSYRGDMGNNGAHDLNRNWYYPPSENIKGSFLYRFFYPLTKLNCFHLVNYISYKNSYIDTFPN